MSGYQLIKKIMLIKELRKIEEILGWHPDFDIDKLVKRIKTRTRFIYFLLSLVFVLSISLFFIYIQKQNTIRTLQSNIAILQGAVWTNESIKDSLMTTLESSGYLKYLIETEADIKIPKNVDNNHIKYMFEKAIDNEIPVSIMFRLINIESKFDGDNVSPNGFGYMQLTNATYNSYCEKLGIENVPKTPEKNILIGSTLLKDNYDYWKERLPNENDEIIWRYALATYNKGTVNDSVFQDKKLIYYLGYIMKKL